MTCRLTGFQVLLKLNSSFLKMGHLLPQADLSHRGVEVSQTTQSANLQQQVLIFEPQGLSFEL